jgi:hypothetical protein
MKTVVEDTYKDVKTSTFLHGPKDLQQFYKHMMFAVFKYYCSNKHADIQEFKELIENTSNYDELKSKIEGCYSDECLSCIAMLCFHTRPRTLLLSAVATLNRIKELENKDEWFSNFALNNYLFSLCMLTYDLFDDNRDGMYSVPNPIHEPVTIQPFDNANIDNSIKYINDYRQKIQKTLGALSENYKSKMINKEHKLRNPNTLLYYFGNTFRNFVLTNSPLPSNPEKVLDAMALIYPYFTGLTHGCDVFWISSKSPSLEDINDFCLRYPYSTVGYILNTNAYADGRGQHWVCVIFRGRTANLICSQASDWNTFSWSKRINSELDRLGFKRYHNSLTIQYDPSSCGLYSSLSTLVFLLKSYPSFEGSNEFLRSIADTIGKNGKGINEIYTIKKYLAGYRK